MRFGASTFIWESPFGDDKLHLAQRVASLGFDTLEICIEDPARVSQHDGPWTWNESSGVAPGSPRNVA